MTTPPESPGTHTDASSPSDGRLRAVRSASDILTAHRGTPIEDLLAAQNLGQPFPVGETPSLLVATCIDSRVRLALPAGAAFELRAAGVNLGEGGFFQIALIVSLVGIRHVALISHDDCAMIGLTSKRATAAQGLARLDAWDATAAEAFLAKHDESWQQNDPIETVKRHARELGERLGPVRFAPLHYSVREHRLYQIDA